MNIEKRIYDPNEENQQETKLNRPKEAEETKEKMEINFEAIADHNFSSWNDALLSKDPGKVAELYTENASFLPTVSDEFKKGQDGAESYFEHFLAKNPAGEIIESRVQPLGPNSYLHSGMYNFEIDQPDAEPTGQRQIVEARFTFNWVRNPDGVWRIIHHHSSVKPQV